MHCKTNASHDFSLTSGSVSFESGDVEIGEISPSSLLPEICRWRLKSGLSAMMGLNRGRDGAREVEQTQENLRERCNAYMEADQPYTSIRSSRLGARSR